MSGTTAILRMISNEYSIPYKDLIKLVSSGGGSNLPSPSSQKQNRKTTLEFITLQNKEYLYKESTNTLYTYDEADPINTICKYGFLIPETLEIISTNGLK